MSPPGRGEIYEFLPRRTRGHEQQGSRPGVVVQSSQCAWLNTVVLVPASTSAAEAVFRPQVEIRGRRTRLLADQVAAVDRARLGRRLGRLDADALSELETTLVRFLGLP